uniref:ShKT domain-containing protein n=1 Tax=Steinernema glaseri TaxID=37863 RepID=A0A1I7Y0P9_9BILA
MKIAFVAGFFLLLTAVSASDNGGGDQFLICEGCCDNLKDCQQRKEAGYCTLLNGAFGHTWKPKIARECRKTCGLCKPDEQ